MRRTLVVLPLLALLARPAATEPPFSRARWIEKHAHEVDGRRFDGGALPGAEQDERELLRLLAARRAADDKRASRPPRVVDQRVSADIVPPDGSGAQAYTEAEPFLAIDPANEKRLLAGFQEGRFESGGARALSFAVSVNGGKSWGNGVLPNLTLLTGGPWQRASDPWVAFGPDHRAYYVTIAFDETRPDNAVTVSTSTDGGVTWGDPVTVDRPTGTRFDDKEAIAVDDAAASPFRGRVYVTWDQVDEADGQPQLLSFSADGGQSFSPPVTLDPNPTIGGYPLVTPDGVVHVIWTRFEGAHFERTLLFTARSTDGGATWSEPVEIAEMLPAGVHAMRVGDGIAAFAADRRNGTLYAVWEDARFGTADQVVLSRSIDGGRTWSAPVRVSDGPLDAAAFTPAVAVDGSGRVGVAYYSNRNDDDRRFRVDEYLAVSKNRGASFAPSARVSAQTFDAADAAIAGGFFLGDYQGLAAGARSFHPLFVATLAPGPNGRPQPDVFTATVK